MPRLVDVAVHDGRGGAEAHAVRRFHHLQPLRRVDLVRADHGAHFVVENLRRGARQRVEAGFLQLGQVVRQREVGGGRALPHFQRREGMHVHLRHGLLHGMHDVDVGGAGVLGVDAALHAHFGAASGPGFAHAALDFLRAQVVGAAAQVFRQLALGEGAELALEVADVGVVDVAVDDVGDAIAVAFLPQPIGGLHDGIEVVAPGADQAHDLGFRQVRRVFAVEAVEDGAEVCGNTLGRRVDAFEHFRGRRGVVAWAPSVGARQALAVDGVEHGAAQALVHPGVHVTREARIDRQAFVQCLAGGSRLAGQFVQMRPRRFRVHEIRRQGRDAAPVVDAGGDDLRQHAWAQVRRRLDAHLRTEQNPRHRNRP